MIVDHMAVHEYKNKDQKSTKYFKMYEHKKNMLMVFFLFMN